MSFQITSMLPISGNDEMAIKDVPRKAFTLIEVLVVLFILLIIASIALPTTKNLLLNQKNARASRSIVGFLDIARSRAIAERRQVGVLIERLSTDPTAEIASASSIRLRQLTSVPPYCGDTSDVTAELLNNDGDTGTGFIPGVDTARFALNDNQLLAVSAFILFHDGDATNDGTAPIQATRDRLELPGGRIVVIKSIAQATQTSPIDIRFDLREEQSASTSFEYPQGSRRQLSTTQRVPFRIHRSPVLSSTAPVTFPRGVAIDLNYSGIGLRGWEFRRPGGSTSLIANSIEIIFGPDGRIAKTNDHEGNSGTPTGPIYLCLGDLDGVKIQTELFKTPRRANANILNLKASWIVINHATGRATSAPMASVSEETLALPESTNAEIGTKVTQAVREARQLAILSDTMDAT
jgi:prepilin-type N-terminal cleavage/methylation domain-containing protein